MCGFKVGTMHIHDLHNRYSSRSVAILGQALFFVPLDAALKILLYNCGALFEHHCAQRDSHGHCISGAVW